MSVDPLAQGVDELYGAPLEEFVARRDALVRQLRAAGDRSAADAVKAMAKPSVAAWTVNQLARRHPGDLAELIAAGAELRSVQEWLLRREADPSDLRRAVEAERAVVGRLAGLAADLLHAAGRRVGPQLLERIAETLHAAASDMELGERALAGRLVREEVAVGMGGGLRLPAMPSRPSRAVAEDDEPEPPEEPEPEPEPDDSERRAALAAAEARAREAAEREREAQRAVGRAQSAMVSREEDLTRADRALREAREQLAAAEDAAGAARAETEAAAAELDELRGGRD